MTHIWQPITILLASLLMATAFAHLLEMPRKMKVSAELWLTFQHNLYSWFAIIGGPLEILTILSASVLAYEVRHSPRVFPPTLAAAIILAWAFFGIWVGLIKPVDSKTASWTLDSIPSDWKRWRTQWEYSHALRFVLHFVALALLVYSTSAKSALNAKPIKGRSMVASIFHNVN